MSWWQDGVLYHVYVRSFADSNGDGVGDLRGLAGRLEYLEWLGVDALWLSPIGRSPNADWGYDAASYDEVDPELGTNGDLEELVREARARGIVIVLDLVPNHTSAEHPWFVESRTAKDSEKRDWYVWADPAPDGGPPNNWKSIFVGDAWELDEATGQYFLHNFLPSMPDLNWWSDDVRAEFEALLRRWFDLGIAGVRVDVAHGLVHDRQLRDNPPAGPDDGDTLIRIGQFPRYSLNQPEVLDVYRSWREIAESYEPQRLLLGETYVVDLHRLAEFAGGGGLHLAMNFAYVHAELDELPQVVDDTYATLPPDAWPVWVASSHDHVRFPTRWADGDGDRARLGLLTLLTLRGTPIVYYGDELLLEQVDLPREALRDPVGVTFWPELEGRDGSRTPMPWAPGDGHGFTAPGVEPWLPFGDRDGRSADEQRADERSPLHLARDLIALRRRETDLRTGRFERLDAPDGSWAYRRGDRHAVALDLAGTAPLDVPLRGRIVLSTTREREGETVDGLTLRPAEGAVLELDA